MMAKEGVVLDFSDTKLKGRPRHTQFPFQTKLNSPTKGRIVTKTKIIKEVVGKDGRTEIVEDEELDEAMFGPDLGNISRLSRSSQEQSGSMGARSVPIYQLGVPVVSSTFERGATTTGRRMSLSSCSGKEEATEGWKQESRVEQTVVERRTEKEEEKGQKEEVVEGYQHPEKDSEEEWEVEEKNEIMARREDSAGEGGGLQRGIPLHNLNMIPMENGNDGEDTEEDHQVSDLIDEALSAEIDVDQEILEAEPEKGVVMVLGAGARVAMVVEGLEARGRTAVACAVSDSGQQQYRWLQEPIQITIFNTESVSILLKYCREVLGQLEGAKGAFVWLVDTWGRDGDEDQVNNWSLHILTSFIQAGDRSGCAAIPRLPPRLFRRCSSKPAGRSLRGCPTHGGHHETEP